METCPTGDVNHHNEPDRERRGTARRNTVTMTKNLHNHQGEGSARPAVDNDAALEYQELDRRPPSPEVASSNKRSRKNKRKRRKRRKNYRND